MKIKVVELVSLIVSLISMVAIAMAVRYALFSGGELASNVLGADWRLYFEPAARALASGDSPYRVDGYWNPAWLLVPLIPIAKLPLSLSVPIIFVANIAAYTWVALKTGVRIVFILPLVVFGGVLMNSVLGNIDGLVALGLLFPTWLGVLVLMIKPQIGMPIVIFWVATYLTSSEPIAERVRKVAGSVTPFVILMIVTTLVYGAWFLGSADAVGKGWNSAPWPWGIPVGLILLFIGVKRRELRWALMAIPFVTPYLTLYTWAFAIMGLAQKSKTC